MPKSSITSRTLYRKNGGGITAKLCKRLNQFLFHVNIPPSVKIGKRLELAHGGFGIVIHADTIIGDDVTIGANAVINFDVPDGCTVVGPKARIVKLDIL